MSQYSTYSTSPPPSYRTYPHTAARDNTGYPRGNAENAGERDALLPKHGKRSGNDTCIVLGVFVLFLLGTNVVSGLIGNTMCVEKNIEHKWNLDQEQRERLGLYWDEPAAGKCLAHGVREYHARLLNAAPYNYNWLQPCQDMPLTIRGESRNTTRCETLGDEIWGHWSVENDPLCSPFFEDWRDDGCLPPGSQLRRASARLDFIPAGEDALALCSTTPLRFWDRYFAHPTTCRGSESQGGVWGHWEVDDGRC